MAKSAATLIKKYKARTVHENQGPRCRFEGEPKVTKLMAELRSMQITYPEIARIVTEEFRIEIGGATVQRHLKGECRCARGR